MPVDHYENFPVASLLLPARLRHPVEVIYQFARHADDLADEGDASPESRLIALTACQAELRRIETGQAPEMPQYVRLAAVIAEYRLPISLFHDLLDAFSQDVVKQRYEDYPELLDYCRRSANPVGRLMLHLFGRTDSKAMQQSDAICTALQLTNFWQDVAIDWEKGRVYLPQGDLRNFGVVESMIAGAACGPAWRDLMAFQVRRTRALMLQGAPLVHALPGRLGWEIRLTVQGGLQILDALERHGGDVFRQRPRLDWRDWGKMLLRACAM